MKFTLVNEKQDMKFTLVNEKQNKPLKIRGRRQVLYLGQHGLHFN